MLDQAQALVDALRSAGAARLIVAFSVDGDTVALSQRELYAMNPNNSDGFSYDAHQVDDAAAIDDATVALLRARYADKAASGKLLVDEADRVWGENVIEHDVEPEPATGLRVDL